MNQYWIQFFIDFCKKHNLKYFETCLTKKPTTHTDPEENENSICYKYNCITKRNAKTETNVELKAASSQLATVTVSEENQTYNVVHAASSDNFSKSDTPTDSV